MKSSMNDSNGIKQRSIEKFFKSKVAIVGLVLFILVLIIALFGEYISSYNDTDVSTSETFMAPSSVHLLGTDSLGRDMFARISAGARLTLIVSICSVLIALVLGTTLGLIGGYFRGKLDIVISGLMDSLWAFSCHYTCNGHNIYIRSKFE